MSSAPVAVVADAAASATLAVGGQNDHTGLVGGVGERVGLAVSRGGTSARASTSGFGGFPVDVLVVLAYC